jgi:hypothetical protein
MTALHTRSAAPHTRTKYGEPRSCFPDYNALGPLDSLGSPCYAVALDSLGGMHGG